MKLKKGFTLVELLVVVSITSFMSSIIFPTLNTARESARDVVRIHDIQQLSLAMELTRDFFTDRYTPLSYTTPYAIGTEMPEVPRNNTENNGIYGWINNTTDPSQYCAYAVLENDTYGGRYYVAGILGAGFMDEEPTNFDECVFYEENSFDNGLQLEEGDGIVGGGGPTGPVCGDGSIDDGEQCDGSALGGATCSSVGYASGSLSCNGSCQYNLSACVAAPEPPVCGDGVVEGSEICDGAALNGGTCSGLGFSGGSLSCASNCTYYTNNCTANNGNGNGVQKVYVCHTDNKGKKKTLNIASPAYDAHIAHGDTPGQCQ